MSILEMIFLSALLLTIGFAFYWFLENSKLKSHQAQFKHQHEQQQQYYQSILRDKKGELHATKKELQRSNGRLEELSANLATYKADFRHLTEIHQNQKSELTDLHKLFKSEFKNLSETVLEEKGKKLSAQSNEQLQQLLNPLKEKIKSFEAKLDNNSKDTISWKAALKEQVTALQNLNVQITKEAEQLTQALKGNVKTQGSWGELQLEKILQAAGLEESTHYSKEKTLKNEVENKNYRPDYIIHLPDNRNIILDAKVSLNNFTRYFETEDTQLKEKFLKQHLSDLYNHIKNLSGKNYQELHQINQPDYIMMFVANEGALTSAIRKDYAIYETALQSNIVLVSASTLIASLKTVAYIWKQKHQEENAQKIALEAGKMYDKFVGLHENLQQVENYMRKTNQSFDLAMNKLKDGKGSLVSKAEKLKQLGISSKKELPN